ncbi:MAG: hypothetical protein QOH88_991 [Verrucomicrobiota bacterium]|jgi:hypothetical protein
MKLQESIPVGRTFVCLAPRALLIGALVSLLIVGRLPAADITGTIIDATASSATATIDGAAVPSIGDSAEIFFKIPGSDVEVSVANGKVSSVEAKTVKITIEKTTGTVEKNQVVRFMSSAPKVTGSSPSVGSSPSEQLTATSALYGEWSFTDSGPGAKILVIRFKEDGSFVMIEQTSEGRRFTATAKYEARYDTKPARIYLSDSSTFDGAKLENSMSFPFELQSDGRLKMGRMSSPKEEVPQGFTEDILVLTRSTTPILLPPETKETPVPASPTPENTPAPAPSPTPTPDARPPDEQKVALGDQYSEAKDFDAAIEAYTEAIKLNPKNASAYYGRGGVFLDKRDYEKSVADYETAIALWKKALALPLDPSDKKSIEQRIEDTKDLSEKVKFLRDSQDKPTTPKAKKRK